MHFFAFMHSSRVSSLPVAAHAVEQQDNSAQAVAGGAWRAKASAECPCFVFPPCYLERQQRTEEVVGGAQPHCCSESTVSMALGEKQAGITDLMWLKWSLGGKPGSKCANISLSSIQASSTEHWLSESLLHINLRGSLSCLTG